jgi:hypothetical protein
MNANHLDSSGSFDPESYMLLKAEHNKTLLSKEVLER